MVIYSSDSGLILVVCSLLIECLLATLIWHQNLAVPRHLVGFPATFPATFPAPSQPPYESVRTDSSRLNRQIKECGAWNPLLSHAYERGAVDMAPLTTTEVWPKSSCPAKDFVL